VLGYWSKYQSGLIPHARFGSNASPASCRLPHSVARCRYLKIKALDGDVFYQLAKCALLPCHDKNNDKSGTVTIPKKTKGKK
jgi:hypothetical protein